MSAGGRAVSSTPSACLQGGGGVEQSPEPFRVSTATSSYPFKPPPLFYMGVGRSLETPSRAYRVQLTVTVSIGGH